MTGHEALNQALILLGYTDQNGNEQLTRRIMNKAVATVNTVYEDLWQCVSDEEFKPINTLSEEIKLKDRALTALPYGVAAFLAQSENDGDQQQLWMQTFNKKRAGLTRLGRIVDTVPHAYDL